MKKLIVILIAALSFSAASAQSRKDSYNRPDRNQVNQARDNRYNNDQQRSNDYAYNNNAYGKDRNSDRSRQENYNRMNQQYDKRIDGYRNDRSLGNYERGHRINEVEQERQEKSNSFGNGMVIGGIAGLLIGILARH